MFQSVNFSKKNLAYLHKVLESDILLANFANRVAVELAATFCKPAFFRSCARLFSSGTRSFNVYSTIVKSLLSRLVSSRKY